MDIPAGFEPFDDAPAAASSLPEGFEAFDDTPAPAAQSLSRYPTANVPVPTPRPLDAGIPDNLMPAVQGPFGGSTDKKAPYLDPMTGELVDQNGIQDPTDVNARAADPAVRARGAAAEEAPTRTGGRIRDLFSSTAGGLTGDEQLQAGKDREADLKSGASIAQADADLAKDIAGQNDALASPLIKGQQALLGRLGRTDAQMAQQNAEDAKKAAREVNTLPGYTQSAASSAAENFGAGIIGIGSGLVDNGFILGSGAARLAGNKDAAKSIDETGTKVRQWFDKWATGDRARADEFGQKMAQGVGSTIGFMGAGLIGKALGLSETATTALAGALPQAAQQYRDAESKGASESEKWFAFVSGLGIGASEALPLAGAFEKWAAASKGGLRQILITAGGQAYEEGFQEGGQQLAGNLAQKVWDENSTAFKDVGSNTAVGALTGALMASAGGLASKAMSPAQREAIPKPADEAIPPLPPELQTPEEQEAARLDGVKKGISDGVTALKPGESFTHSGMTWTRGEDDADGKRTMTVAPTQAAPPATPNGETPPPSVSPSPPNAASPAPNAAPTPAAPAAPAAPGLSDEDTKLLLGAGNTLEQIREMNPDEVQSELEDARSNGTVPATAIPDTVPEPASDIEAQLRAMSDPGSTKDTVFVANGTEVPTDIPDGAQVFTRPEGTIVTTNPDKIKRLNDPAPLSDEEVGQMLGFPDTKMNAAASLNPQVVQGTDANGNVIADAVTSPEKLDETKAAVEQQVGEGGSVAVRDPMDVVGDRGGKKGVRKYPVKVKTAADIETASAAVNTAPTEGQKEAGNYQMGHVSYDGLDISIENPKGSTRSGVDKAGKAWESTLPAAYGYVKGTKGADGDHVDTYIAGPSTGKAFVIDQFDPDTGAFDEHKIVLGVETEAEARELYGKAFTDGKHEARIGGVREMPTEYLKSWLNGNGARKAPVSNNGKIRQGLYTGKFESADEVKPADVDKKSAESKKKPKKGEKKQVGFNTDGLPVFEDSNGVRSVSENGISRTETVRMSPNGGIQGTGNRGTEFKTAEEVAAAQKPNESETNQTPESERPDGLAGTFFDHFAKGGRFETILVARKMAKEAGYSDNPKQIEEALELAIVLTGRQLIQGKSESDAFDALVDLYKRQPSLNMRTSTSIRDQAYSTPIPLAYLASRLAGAASGWVLEPTAGNGALLIEVDPALQSTTVNEINPDRRAALRVEGFNPTAVDASFPTAFEKQARKVDVVIANPPFGVVRDFAGNSVSHDLNDIQRGYTTNEIDHAISLRALEAMKDDGRAVLIIGAVNKLSDASDAYHGKAKRAFYKTLYDRYNVTDLFTVDGALYSRQGASWPVDVIVIEGRGKSEMRLPAAVPPPVLSSWDEVKEKLNARPARDGVENPDQAVLSPPAGGTSGAATGDNQAPAAQRPADVRPGQDTAGPVSAGSDSAEQRPGPGAAGSGPRGTAGSRKPRGPDLADPAVGRPSGLTTEQEVLDAIAALYGEPVAPPSSTDAASGDVRRPNGEPSVPKAPPKTSTQLAASAATNTGSGLAEAFEGLAQLFGAGDPTRLGSGPVFDSETYAKAKPFFIKAAQHFWSAMKDVGELVMRLVTAAKEQFNWSEKFIREMVPYLVRFVDDVRSGKTVIATATDEAPAAERKAAKPEQETAKQVLYKPRSKMEGMGSLVPVGLQTSIDEALDALEAVHGDVDAYVADRLGYEPGEIAKRGYFMAEQVDAIALALHNFEQGKGFIIGDQTGIGKGRVNAAMIAYAIRQGHVPIFTTEKPNLYGDMYRDLKDIGRAINPEDMFLTNSDTTIALDDEAQNWTSERDQAKANNTPLPPKRGLFLKAGGAVKKKRELAEFTASGRIGNYKVVFTTYDQTNTVNGKITDRIRFLEAVAPNAIMVLDEVHNAGGTGVSVRQSLSAPPPRSQIVRGLIDKAISVFYSSATYAKRPQVMDLYRKTDMILAVKSNDALAEAIANGGIPMQQVVASMLAKSGQYIRRERSFAGVKYETPEVEVDRQTYNDFSTALAEVLQFSRAIGRVTAEISRELKDDASNITADGSVGAAGAESTKFTSVMHNLISQFLLGLKADQAADRAIAAIKAGEKPVITVANTAESFLSDYADNEGLKVGDEITIDFTQMVLRYLERTRWITIKDAYGDKTKHRLTDEELGPHALAIHDQAKAFIEGLDMAGVPVSPIDHIKMRINREGYAIGEITGRGLTIDYTGRGKGVLKMRPAGEISAAGRGITIGKFNNQRSHADGYSALILNKAGSTGLSLHANKTFRNQNPRVMIIAQAEQNIDTHMQMLGRIHRTGQVVLPRFEQLVANVPAELRPAAVLSKKMASLSASTTASRKGGMQSEDVPDFMNEYGDQVAAFWLQENPELAWALGDMAIPEDDTEGTMAKLTGRIPLLQLEKQEEVYGDLIGAYKDLLDQAEAAGTNALEAKALDLDAKVVQQHVMAEPTGPSIFQGGVTLNEMDIKRQGAPFTGENVVTAFAEAQGAEATNWTRGTAAAFESVRPKAEAAFQDVWNKAMDEHSAWAEAKMAKEDAQEDKDAIAQAANKERAYFGNLTSVVRPGAVIQLSTEAGVSHAVVLKVEPIPGKTKSPLAPSGWRVTLAGQFENRSVMQRPLSQFQLGDDSDTRITVKDASISLETALRQFDHTAAGGLRESRIIATGNILRAFDLMKGRGMIATFTDDQGRTQPGIVMARGTTWKDAVGATAAPIGTGAEVIDYAKGYSRTVDRAREIEIVPMGASFWVINVKGARAQGGKYYLNQRVLEAAGQDFMKAGPFMKVEVREDRAIRVIDAMIQAGAEFEKTAKAAPAAKQTSYSAPSGWEFAEAMPAEDVAAITTAVNDIVDTITARGANVMVAPRIDVGADGAQAMRNSGGKGEGTAGGFFRDSLERGKLALIAVSLQVGDKIETAAHEAWHFLQSRGLISDQEKAVIDREMPRLRAQIAQLAAFRGHNMETMTDREVEAYAFGRWYSEMQQGNPNATGFHIALRRAFMRAAEIIRRIGNMMRGMGYQTAEDVFKRASTGEIGNRRHDMAYRAGHDIGTAYSTVSTQTQQEIAAANARVGSTVATRAPVSGNKVFDETDTTMLDDVVRKLQDNFVDLRRAQTDITAAGRSITEAQNTYDAVGLMAGRRNERIADLLTDHVAPLVKAMKAAKVTSDELHKALLAQHAPERNAEMATRDPARFDPAQGGTESGSGLATAAAQQMIADWQASGRWAVLQPLMQRVYAMIELDRRNRLRSGLISQKQYDGWRNEYQYYVPLRGFADNEDDSGPMLGAGLDVRGKETRTAFGRSTQSANTVMNTILQAQEGIVRAEKNRVMRALLKMVQAHPNPDLWKINERRWKRELDANGQVRTVRDHSIVNDDNVVGVKIGGHTTYITLKNADMARNFKELSTEAMSNVVVRAFGKFTRLFASMQTRWAPEFFVKNFLRDMQEAGFTAFAEQPALAAAFAKELLPAIKTSIALMTNTASAADKRSYDEWRRMGGKISFNAFRDLGEIAADINGELASANPLSWKNLPQKSKNAMQKSIGAPLLVLDHINEAFETATRLAMYRAAIAMGRTPGQAARLARESTVNFTRRGEWGSVINSFKAFFNASVQGNAKLAQMLITPRGATPAQKAAARRAQALFLGLIPLASLLTLWNMAMCGDDDDDLRKGRAKRNMYESIPQWVRDKNLIIVYGTHMDNGKKVPDYIKIPTAFGLGIPVVIGENLARVATGQIKPGAAAWNVISGLANAFNPLGQGSWIEWVMPTLAQPGIELKMNKDAFDNDIVPRFTRPGVDRADQYHPSTGELAIQTASKLRDHGVDLYPEWLEYTTQWVGGGIGRTMSGTYKAFAGDEPTPWDKLPIARQFAGHVGKEAEQGLYYQNRNEVQGQFNKASAARKALDANPDDARARANLDKGMTDLDLQLNKKGTGFVHKGDAPGLYNQADKEIKGYRDEITAIRRDAGKSISQKAAEVEAVRNKMDTLMRSTRRDSAAFPGLQ